MDNIVTPCKKCNGINFKIQKIKRTGKISRYCVDCNKASAKAYVKKNRRKYTAVARLKNTGFTETAYMQKLYEQDARCGICGISLYKYGKNFAADHNHTTGKLRGLLCQKCNVLLGHANDDLKILEAAITYLKQYE